MNKEELQEILGQHKLWLDFETDKGVRADLQYANLQNANLKGANLKGADLPEANLQNSNLQYADLRGANLRGANLRGANLRGANLQGADLQGANLRGVNLKDACISYEEEPNVPILLGNILVTEVLQPGGYWWRVITWIELKPNEMEMAELLYG